MSEVITIQSQRNDLRQIYEATGETFVLIRIPKTGSASMSRALYNTGRRNADKAAGHLLRSHLHIEEPGKGWGHWSAQFCVETLGRKKWEKSFTFSVVRNPWARLYSFWKSTGMKLDPTTRLNTWQGVEQNFEDWLLGGCEHGWNQTHQLDVLPSNPLLSQTGWITDASGKILVNSVLRLEDMDSTGTAFLKGVFGETFMMPPNHVNKNALVNEYQEHYTPEMIDYVSRHCKDDIKTFWYNFEGLAG